MPLGDYASDRRFYCRIPAMRNHAIVILSDRLIFHEATRGPFDQKDTIFPSWSPAENDAVAVEQWFSRLQRPIPVQRRLLKVKRVSEQWFSADESPVSIGRHEIEFLKAVMRRSQLGEMGLEINLGSTSPLREIIQLRLRQQYVRPRMLPVDESIHVLEGAADVLFFDDNGTIMKSIPIGSYGSERKFYVRVPAQTHHFVLMHSDLLVTHEVKTAPSRSQEISFAAWSPDESNGESVGEFLENLSATISSLG